MSEVWAVQDEGCRLLLTLHNFVYFVKQVENQAPGRIIRRIGAVGPSDVLRVYQRYC